MKNYLPIVSKNVAYSTCANLRNCEDETYVNNNIKEIKKINPVIADWLVEFCPTTEDKMGCMFAGIVLYKMLYSQAEAEDMNKQYGF
jgi:hypothetical protein